MAINSFALRTALYNRLSNQLSDSVYSYVPQDAAFPYVRIADISASTDDTKTTESQVYDVTIDTFDRSVTSSQTIEGLMAEVYAALHHQESNITPVGYTVVLCRQTQLQAFQQGEPNDRYWHGIQRFAIHVQDT